MNKIVVNTFVCFVSIIVLISGCTSVQQETVPKNYSEELQNALSGVAILGHTLTKEELPDVDLFAITPDMAAFAEHAIKLKLDLFDKVQALHRALIVASPEGRGISYGTFYTMTPGETFEQRKANCLGYSMLYAALARHLGMDVYINDVQVPPTWNLRGRSSFIFLRHVNVKVRLAKEKQNALSPDEAVIDFEMSSYRPYYQQHAISDDIVAALYYSNRGMDILNDKNIEGAFIYLRKALDKNDQQSHIWNNMGTIYMKKGLYREAEIVYLQGLKLNDQDLSIINNLALLYKRINKPKEAEGYRKLAEHHRDKNPYYQYTLAYSEFDDHKYTSALNYIKHAIKMEDKEPRFYELAATIYLQLGNAFEAEVMQKKYDALLAPQ